MVSINICNKAGRFVRNRSVWIIIGLLIYLIKIKIQTIAIITFKSENVKRSFPRPVDQLSNNVIEVNTSLYQPHSKLKCTSFPETYQLKFSNTYWQVEECSTWTMYMFNAYYDIRVYKTLGDYIRILAMMNKVDQWKNSTFWCQLWTTVTSTPTFVIAEEFHPIWPPKFGPDKQSAILPYLISCRVPKNIEKLIFAVSIVPQKCVKASNKLKVNYDIPLNQTKETFAVCVKGLDFPQLDISVGLIEWIELLKLLGVHKIYFYEMAVHPNAKHVLNYYEQKKTIEVTPFTLPGFFPNEPFLRHQFLTHDNRAKRRIELVPYNDCFYRLMNKYNYITLLDVDEIIIPMQFQTWNELMETFKNKSMPNDSLTKRDPFAFYGVAQNGCFFKGVKRDWIPEVPAYLPMLQHIYKIPYETRSVQGIKGFFNPNIVLSVLNHNPRSCLIETCKRYFAKLEDAQLQHYKHYKRYCGKKSLRDKITKCDKLSCQDYVTDKTIWKYKVELIFRVDAVLKELEISH